MNAIGDLASNVPTNGSKRHGELMLDSRLRATSNIVERRQGRLRLGRRLHHAACWLVSITNGRKDQIRRMLVATEEVSPNMRPQRELPNDWCFYLIDHLNEFARLVWYLVADTALVECVMLRAVARLEGTPFDASDSLVNYNQARDTLIGEAIAALNLPLSGDVDAADIAMRPPTLCELPDLPRLAFLLKLVLRMPELDVARLLSVQINSVADLIGFAIFRLSQRLPAAEESAVSAA
jgi:hypothetical protein